MGLLEDLDLSSIQDERLRKCIVLLLNLVEDLKGENTELRAENQRLRDENNRLKGEQGKPRIKPNAPKPALSMPTDYSSEQRRRTPKEWTKGKKTETIRIDREQVLEVDPATLPPDAEFKGHEDVVVQDVVLGTDDVLFHKEKYHSPSQGKTYPAPLPSGYDGQFGPGLKALSIVLYYGANVSEPKIVELCLLRLPSRPHLQGQPDAGVTRCDHRPSQGTQPGGFLEWPIALPPDYLRRYIGSSMPSLWPRLAVLFGHGRYPLP